MEKPKGQIDLFNSFVLCDNCKNYKKCRSMWRGSVNSVHCQLVTGFYEPIELEEIPPEIDAGEIPPFTVAGVTAVPVDADFDVGAFGLHKGG